MLNVNSVAELDSLAGDDFLTSMLLYLRFLVLILVGAGKAKRNRAWSHFETDDSYGFLRYHNVEGMPRKRNGG